MNLEDHKCNQAPPTIFYIPNFITENEEHFLIKHVNDSPRPKWTQLSNRRLQNWGGLPHPKGMIAESLPQWLTDCMRKVSELGMFGDKLPNHVLINEYLTKQGIMPHTDGPLFHPVVTTISCGSHTVLDFYQPRVEDLDNQAVMQKPCLSLLLEQRSLVVITGEMYETYLHGIQERDSDVVTNFANLQLLGSQYKAGDELIRNTRLSLTIRHVPKTRKIPGFFNL